MKKHDGLGDRMKAYYEGRSQTFLTRRTPVIIRLDGKAFHTFTIGCDKPFDTDLIEAMDFTGEYLINNIQGAKLVYAQSDEISILLTDFDKLTTDAWFDYNVQKMTSVSAAMASVIFSDKATGDGPSKHAFFDSRAFNIPSEEVLNYFRWRYKDWVRNSIQMLAQSLFSHSELQKVKTSELHELCHSKGYNWAKLPPRYKNGKVFFRENATYDEKGDKQRGYIKATDSLDFMSDEAVNLVNSYLFKDDGAL